MKNILGFILVFLITACSQNHDMVINGSIDKSESVKIIRYVPDSNNQPRPYDTVVANGGEFNFKVALDKPVINFITVEGTTGNFPFVAEKGEIEMAINTKNIANSSANGTISNDDFVVFKTKNKEFGEQLNKLSVEINEALQYNDNLLVEELQKQYTQAQQQAQAFEKQMVSEKTDSYIAALILERMISGKVMTVTEAKPLFANYSERIKNTVLGQGIQSVLSAPLSPTAIGNKAPNFKAPTPEGTTLELQKQLSKITVLDFWASWCRPCRVENPNLVRTYNKLKDKGLHIVSVSLDRDKKRWVQAIKDDGLTWDHVSNLQYWRDPVAQLYKVSSIPAMFILDENGVILAKNLRGPQLEAKLTQLLQ